ncbi:MAG TPA: hypothetical protein VL551_26415 [Actinospica sp.]|jgi:hypothetical protein|nr:hypothetical protein [Actinospica sp.]
MSDYADPADAPRPTDHEAPVHTNRAKPVRAPKRSGRHAARDLNLSFDSAAASVPLALVADSPTLLVAAVEDLVWRLDVLDWTKRRPSRSDREAHAAWLAEARRFNEKGARIQEMVTEALMAS